VSFLTVNGISRRFAGFLALDNVSLSVGATERRALIGPNGAGKSTLFNILAGQMPPSAGQVLLNGEDITASPLHSRAHRGIARTFQRNNLFARKSVFENVRLSVQAHSNASWSLFSRPAAQADINAAAGQVIDRLGLGPLVRMDARDLSYGDQRKVELAIALAGNPKLLLVDEPTAGMSASETAQMVDVLMALTSGIALIIVEHDMEVVSAIADRVTVLQNGKLIAEGTWKEIQDDVTVRRAYMGKARMH
jgi:branched-chain amino acid transport system ATP-binding protein